jgi:hypothetical protein
MCLLFIPDVLLQVASKQTRLEVNSYKTKYMVIFGDQKAGRRHSIKIYNGSLERVKEFTYLETNLTNQNSIQKEIKSGMMSGNTCYHSV